jgi:hypothetical protein
MTRTPDTRPPRQDDAPLEEIDLGAMETVSGGCAACGQQQQTTQGAGGASGIIGKIMPLISQFTQGG